MRRSVAQPTPGFYKPGVGWIHALAHVLVGEPVSTLGSRPRAGFAGTCASRREMPMNGADVIADILKREGTEFLACYPRNPLIEACAAIDIRPILCRQERVGVGMADGYTRIKRGKRNGVFAAQAGPGIENAFPGIAQAFSENVPLLMIPAGLPLARQYLRPGFRAADLYRPVTKWSALAPSVQEIPY